MISPEEFLDLTSATANHRAGIKRTLMGYIDYNFDINTYPTEWPKVIIDGQGLSQRTYPCLSTYFPRPGDRVVMVPVGTGHVIVGAVLDNPTPPLQPGTLVFQAYSQQNQTVASGVATAVIWDNVQLDLLGGWVGNMGAGEDFRSRYSPTIPGWYTLRGAIGWGGNANGWRSANWAINGQTNYPHSAGRVVGHDANYMVNARTVSYYLNGSGDYVELNGIQNSGTNLNMIVNTFAPNIEVTYAGPGELNTQLPSVE